MLNLLYCSLKPHQELGQKELELDISFPLYGRLESTVVEFFSSFMSSGLWLNTCKVRLWLKFLLKATLGKNRMLWPISPVLLKQNHGFHFEILSKI